MNIVKPSIHQFVAGFASGDAISQAALAVRDLARGMGAESEIFVPSDCIAPDMRSLVHPLEAFPGSDLLIHHYSIASPLDEAFHRSTGRKVIYYHNITPDGYFIPYAPTLAIQLREARKRLPVLLTEADAVWAVSEFNAAELRAAGAPRTSVFPLIFDPDRLAFHPTATRPDPSLISRDMTNILFVGRLAPNKCVEDLILAFAWYQMRFNERSRLILIGSDRTVPAYFAMLRMLAHKLELCNVIFQRFVPAESLSAWYDAASLFVCASRHEGFCLPLVEAMSRHVPVIARAIGGMPEALNGAGILYDELKPEEMATLWQRVLTDQILRTQVLESQNARMELLLKRPLHEEFAALVHAAAPNLVMH